MNVRRALLLVGCLVARGASVYVYPQGGGGVVVVHPGHVAVFDLEGRQSMVPCSCNQGGCSCCAPVYIPQINVNQQGCLNTIYDSSNLAVAINFKFGNTVIFEQTLSASNPPPICYPIPQLPMVTVCLRLYNIKLVDGGVYTCIKVEFQAFTATVLILNFDCVQITNTGVVTSKPHNAPSSPPVIDVGNVWYIFKPENRPQASSTIPTISNQSIDEEYDVINETKNPPTDILKTYNSSKTLGSIEGAINIHSNTIVMSINAEENNNKNTSEAAVQPIIQHSEGPGMGRLEDFKKLGEIE